ncbi:MAG: type III pantothenate kinase [Gammaproteobacteria bacterium]|nr:MAG: type III pantothenate kinase [Gammaproteobacteria bacterium]
MKLLIDIGNHRLKWATYETKLSLTNTEVMDATWLARLAPRWSSLPLPDAVWVSCVVSEDVLHQLGQWVARTWSLPVDTAGAVDQQLGVKNRYTRPEEMGSDRWLAMIAAHYISPDHAVCIVDAGTAVTVDAVDREGNMLGGAIFPGLHLLRNSLTTHTAEIHKHQGQDNTLAVTGTADAVAVGTRLGLIGAVKEMIQHYRAMEDDDMQVIITGGDAEVLLPELEGAEHIPGLVLQGLARVAEAGA